MSDVAPINLKIVDDSTGESIVLFAWEVPFRTGLTVRNVLEEAFVFAQSITKNPDPFAFTVAYYGYSESARYPGYLGYEIESLCGKTNTDASYWDLILSGVTSQSGADTTFPGPGDTVLWKYTAAATAAVPPSARSAAIRARRIGEPK